LDLELDEETLAFAAEVRDFLSANAESIPTESYDNAEGFAQHRHWDKVLFDAGLSVINWPKKYGGRDAPLLHWVVFEEEYFRAGAPGRASANGTSMLAPTQLNTSSEATGTARPSAMVSLSRPRSYTLTAAPSPTASAANTQAEATGSTKTQCTAEL